MFQSSPSFFFGRRPTRLPRKRSLWIAPQEGEDSEVEVNDLDFDLDDDVTDPEFQLDHLLPEEDEEDALLSIPSTSKGKKGNG